MKILKGLFDLAAAAGTFLLAREIYTKNLDHFSTILVTLIFVLLGLQFIASSVVKLFGRE